MEFPIAVEIKKRLARLFKFYPNKYTLESVPGGKMYMNKSESRMMMERSFGIYEYWKIQTFKEILKPGMTVIDVGVNKGDFTLLSSKLVKENGSVLSFEPDPNNCEWIRKSIDANGYENIKLYPFALSDCEGEFDFYVGRKSGFGSLMYVEKNALSSIPIKIRTRILDDLLKSESINKIDLIKIDVQGADLKVIKGGINSIRKAKYLIMDVDTNDIKEQEEIFKILIECGFTIYHLNSKRTKVNSFSELALVKDIFCAR